MRFSFILLLLLIASPAVCQEHPIFADSRLFRSLSERWEIDTADVLGNFRITAYQPTYILFARYTSNPNRMPQSFNPEYALDEEIPLNATELKFQLSFKTKIIRGFIFKNLDVWAAYTQKSHWQLYNGEISRPFRETNYEPELILNYRMNLPLLGFRARIVGVAFNHQSNGRTLPLSRSWNRIVFHLGLEREFWQIYLKPWIRLNDSDDENPEITNYYGRMQAIVSRRFKEHLITVDATHSLRFGENNRGSIRIDWAFPIDGFLHGRLEIFEGYGETLIDYNHRQFVIGLGLSLIEWR